MVDKSYINFIVSRVINDNFSSQYKRRIIEHSDRVNFCCPYCGDGQSEHKKRGNIYYNKLVYICFNCDKKTNFNRFCKDFNQALDPDKKLEILNYLDSVITARDVVDDSFSQTHLDNLIPLDLLVERTSREDSFLKDLKPAGKDEWIQNYLLSRGITQEFQKNIWCAKYVLPGGKWEPVICFLNRRGDRVLSMQIRNLKDGRKRMFKVYNFEFLYKFIHSVEDIEELDSSQVLNYNKLGYFFGILDVDFEEKITIFEGYLDSLFFPNSIGVIGVNTDMGFLENNNLDIRYFFDNDKTGDYKTYQKIKGGFSCFLWRKLFEHLSFLKKPEDPYAYQHRLSKIKDLNKLSQLVQEPYKKLELESFFSRDLLDISWIPKAKKSEYRKKYIYNKNT
jgi:hypothetical protein